MSKKLGNQLDNNLIKKMYIEDEMSMAQIAKILGVARGTISNRIKNMGLAIRMNSHYTKKNIKIDYDELKDLGISKYANKYDISSTVIKRVLTEDNRSRPINWEAIEEDIKKYLSETKNYEKTAHKFNIGINKLIAKNNRDWRIVIQRNLGYTRDEVAELLKKYKKYSIVSDITGIKYNSLKSINSKYLNIKIDSQNKLGKSCKDISGYEHKSIFEAKIANELILAGVNFNNQKRICNNRKWTCDFYLIDDDIYLESDGLGDNRKDFISYCNEEKIRYYKNRNLNYKIVTNLSELRKYILPQITKKRNILQWRPNNIIVRRIKYKVARYFCSKNHYTKTLAHNNQIILGYFLYDKLVGIISFGPGANKNLISGVAGDNYNGLELTRLCAIDIMAHNFESFMIGSAFKYLKNNNPIDILVSFADPHYGHIGTIYQATNWIYTGTTGKSYEYLLPNNETVHKSKFRCKNGKTEKQLANEAGAKKIITPGKHRYIYILNKKKRKEILSNLNYKILSYPK